LTLTFSAFCAEYEDFRISTIVYCNRTLLTDTFAVRDIYAIHVATTRSWIWRVTISSGVRHVAVVTSCRRCELSRDRFSPMATCSAPYQWIGEISVA